MSEETSKNMIPTWFRIVGWVALLWNLMGVFAYLSTVMMTPEMLANVPDAQRDILENTPAWATGAFAFAVFGGVAGSILLLLKKKTAFPLFIISFLGVIVQLYHSLFMTNSLEVYGPSGAITPILVFLFSGFMVWLSRSATEKNWIE